MANVVLYHGPLCPDGFCAAWVVRLALREALAGRPSRISGETTFIPVNYDEPGPPIADGSKLWILDFSYPRQALLDLAGRCESVVVLDHHKSAQEELAGLMAEAPRGNLSITFDLEKSGARLTWDYFFPDTPPHWLVDYTQDRDLWHWRLPFSREISAALASYPLSFDEWDRLAMHHAPVGRHFQGNQKLVREGTAILRFQDQLVEKQCRSPREVTLAGYKVPCVNASMLISETAGRLAEGKPFAVVYHIDSHGRKIVSLRSREGGVDVSAVAKQMGGGGHPQAAGFKMAHGEEFVS